MAVLQKFDAFDLVGGEQCVIGSDQVPTAGGSVKDVRSFLALMRVIAVMFHFETAQLVHLMERMPSASSPDAANAAKCASAPRCRRCNLPCVACLHAADGSDPGRVALQQP